MAGTLEASEVFTAASMFFTKYELDFAIRKRVFRSGVVHLTQDFFPKAKEMAEKHIVFGERRNDWLRKFDESDSYANWANVADMVRGISAALAIKKWLSKTGPYGMGVKGGDPVANTVYLTGSTWPSPVDLLNIDVDGFKAYNSSDIIITVEPNSYYGVSLKKKPTADSVDPTMINKAFDTVIQGPKFKGVRDELESVREKYFAKLVRNAVNLGHIYLPIQTTNSDFTKNGLTRDGKTQLIKITLRTDLLKELKQSTGLQRLGAMKIGFALVTGIGEAASSARKLWDKNGDITLYKGKAYDIDCVLKGLTHLDHLKSAADDYHFEITNKFEEEGDMDQGSGAAKVKFDLIKKGIPLMHMELRYKGGFGGQPQFFGYMTDDFKDVLAGQCV
jgi:hypothetical protein